METGLLVAIAPSYDNCKYLGNFLDSLLKQTYKNWKAVIVDDGSTDDSIILLENYSQKDRRIVYQKRGRQPKGAQTCRNIGLEIAKDAEFVCFFDSDDVLAPYCFEQRVRYMKQNPHLDFAIFPAKEFAGNYILDENYHLWGIKMFNESDLQTFLLGPLPFVVWNNIYRRESLVKHKLFWDEEILSKQDSDYNMQALFKGLMYEYASPSKVDYFYRVNIDLKSIARNIHKESHFNSHLHLLSKVKEGISHYGDTFNKQYCAYLLYYANLFLNTKNAKYINSILTICKHISFVFFIRLYLYKKLFCRGNNQKINGWIEALLFPIIHFRNKKRELFRVQIGKMLYTKILDKESI